MDLATEVALVSAKSGGGLMGIWKRHQHGQSSDVIAEEFIKQKTVNKETGELTYTHDSVRRAYIHLHRALPNMFKYIMILEPQIIQMGWSPFLDI